MCCWWLNHWCLALMSMGVQWSPPLNGHLNRENDEHDDQPSNFMGFPWFSIISTIFRNFWWLFNLFHKILCELCASFLFLPPPPSSSSSSPDLICQFLIAVGLAGPHLPALDCSGPRRTSTASSWPQWASPDLICQLWIAVGPAGPPLPPLDRSRPRRTSTGESLLAVGLAGPQPARFGAL